MGIASTLRIAEQATHLRLPFPAFGLYSMLVLGNDLLLSRIGCGPCHKIQCSITGRLVKYKARCDAPLGFSKEIQSRGTHASIRRLNCTEATMPEMLWVGSHT
jgi:hypothetical protein